MLNNPAVQQFLIGVLVGYLVGMGAAFAKRLLLVVWAVVVAGAGVVLANRGVPGLEMALQQFMYQILSHSAVCFGVFVGLGAGVLSGAVVRGRVVNN